MTYGRLLTVLHAGQQAPGEGDDQPGHHDAVVAAVHELNEVLGPVLYGTPAPRPR